MTICPICNGNIEFTIKKVIYTYEEHIKEINQSAEYCVSCEESFLSAKDLESTQKKIIDLTKIKTII